MIRPIIIAACMFIATLGTSLGNAAQQNGGNVQQNVQFKYFTPFKQLAPGVDFYASNRQAVAPYEKATADAIAKLKDLFGTDLPKGAIFICSTLEQKDAVYEPRVIKAGYGWTLTVITPEVKMQEMMARNKSQIANVPADLLARFKSRQTEMMADTQNSTVISTMQQMSYAVVQSMLVKDLQYRSWRLDDMGKSPLPDWLDIGIAAYVSGSQSTISYLEQNLDQTFPIEDVLTMARPFVSSSTGSGNGRGGGRNGGGNFDGGQGMPQGGFGGGNFDGGNFGGQGMPQGGFGGNGGGRSNGSQGMSQGNPGGNAGGRSGGGQAASQSGSGNRTQGSFGGGGGRGGMQRALPKDEQDRAVFDGQAVTFFAYMVEKAGIEKVKDLVKQAVDGKESREVISKPDVFGPDFTKIEENWLNWVKALKPSTTVRSDL